MSSVATRRPYLKHATQVPIAKTVYLSEQGDDKNDGLTDETPVRTAAKAVKTSIKFGAQGICVLGSGAMLERLNAELAEERKKAMRP